MCMKKMWGSVPMGGQSRNRNCNTIIRHCTTATTELQIISHLCLFFSNCLGKKCFQPAHLRAVLLDQDGLKKKHEEENQRVCIFLLHLVYTVRYFPFSRFVLRAVFIIATLYACVSHSFPHFGPASLKKTLNVMLKQFKQHRYNIFPSEINITLKLRTRWDEISFCKKHLQ